MITLYFSWMMMLMRRIRLRRCGSIYLFWIPNLHLETQIDEGFSDDDLESNLQRDKHARLCNTVNQLIDELTPSAPDGQISNACGQLVGVT